MKELKFNINYLFHKREFYFTILIAFLVNLIHVILCVVESINTGVFYEMMQSSEYQFILYNPIIALTSLTIIIFPIMLSMIFSDSNFLENKRKTVYMLASRINNKSNILSRLLLSIITTFFICFLGFSFNYILLRIIYGSGNIITYYQETAFHLTSQPSWFLDELRLSNPILFTFIINILVSFMYSLLVAFSYILSFFVKNRLIIYFVPLCCLVLSELLFPVFHLSNFSFIKCLQPFSKYNLIFYFSCVGILTAIGMFLLIICLKKKDILV